ncbi:MAG TPA: hypothetical protein VHG92_06745, partial [Afifellaceae bacterium]|nr:hypothetical protein [Afifellaceae bacterium]
SARTATRRGQFVQIKCGRWDRLDPHALVLPVAEEDTTLFAYYAHHLSWSRMVPAAQWAERYPALIERIGSERVQKNWHAIAEALAVARLYDPALAEWIDGTTRPRGESHWRRSAEISLRTLMIHGRRSREAAFPYWCKLEALRVRRGVSFRELALLGPALLSRGLLRPDSRRLGRTLASAPDREEGLVEDEEALAELSRAIAAWGDHQSPESHEIAARYCRIREPHWIVPMAYLLHPLLPAGWEQAIDIDALLGRRSSLFGGAFSSRTHRRALDDLILLLDLADRAGAFGRLADQLVAMADAGDRMLVKVRGRASDLEGDSAIAV